MTFSDFKHIYFGSPYCGPCEAFFRLKHKNLLLPRIVRKVSILHRIAARRIDLAWRIDVQTFSDGILSTLEEISRREKLEENKPLVGENTIFLNAMVVENIYPLIGVHALLASANNRKVSKDANIIKLLNLAELIIEQTANEGIRNEQIKRYDGVRESIEACLSFGFYCAMSRLYGKNDDDASPILALTAVWTDLTDDLIYTLTVKEQRHVYSILGISDEDVACKYIRKGIDLTNQYPGEFMESGFLESREQFADFVNKGKAFGVFSGWDDSTNTPSRRDVGLNENNPVVAQVLAEKKAAAEADP